MHDTQVYKDTLLINVKTEVVMQTLFLAAY